jgi:5-methylcytosine-specific restriction endonuclease McrA
MACARPGETGFVIDGRGYYRCRKCRAESVSRRRRKMKEILVSEAGGACSACGYSGSRRALHFHHLDPAQKRFELNAKGVALALDTLRAEARKCVLLCSNCHAEVEERGTGPPPDEH